MTATNTDPETQVVSLAERYGQPQWVRASLRFSSLPKSLNARAKRVAEVVFAIAQPGGRILLHTKSFYPPGAWRLPSGSIEAGEGIEQALWREVSEETSLQAEVTRFVAVIDYDVTLPESRRAFRSYVFLLRGLGGELRAADAGERVTAFREIAGAELPAVADALEALGADPDPAVAGWGDWGRYRAVAHRALWQALQERGAGSVRMSPG